MSGEPSITDKIVTNTASKMVSVTGCEAVHWHPSKRKASPKRCINSSVPLSKIA